MRANIAGWKLLIALVVAVPLVWLGSEVAKDPRDNVTLVGARVDTAPSGERFVTGMLRNNTDRSYDRVEVEIDLLDGAGASLGRTTANTTNFGGRELWSFAAPITRNDATRFRVVRLTCQTGRRSENRCPLGGEIDVQ